MVWLTIIRITSASISPIASASARGSVGKSPAGSPRISKLLASQLISACGPPSWALISTVAGGGSPRSRREFAPATSVDRLVSLPLPPQPALLTLNLLLLISCHLFSSPPEHSLRLASLCVLKSPVLLVALLLVKLSGDNLPTSISSIINNY